MWEGKWRRFNCVTSNPLNGLSCASSAEKQRRMTEQGESRVIFSTRSICSSFRARALSVGFADSSEASLGPGQWPHSLVPLCTEWRLFVASRARTPLHPPPENSQSHCKVRTSRPPGRSAVRWTLSGQPLLDIKGELGTAEADPF